MNTLDNRTNFKSEEHCTRAKSYQWQAVIKGKVVLSSGVLRNRKRDLYKVKTKQNQEILQKNVKNQ